MWAESHRWTVGGSVAGFGSEGSVRSQSPGQSGFKPSAAGSDEPNRILIDPAGSDQGSRITWQIRIWSEPDQNLIEGVLLMQSMTHLSVHLFTCRSQRSDHLLVAVRTWAPPTCPQVSRPSSASSCPLGRCLHLQVSPHLFLCFQWMALIGCVFLSALSASLLQCCTCGSYLLTPLNRKWSTWHFPSAESPNWSHWGPKTR